MEIDVMDIPEKHKKMLKSLGITRVEQLAGMNENMLAMISGISVETAEKIIKNSWKYYDVKFLDSKELMETEEKGFIPTPLEKFNSVLKGGFEIGTSVSLYGPYASGKTEFCFTQSAMVASNGDMVIFIDTEQTFSIKRYEEIVINRGLDVKKAMENIKVVKAPSSAELMLLSYKLPAYLQRFKEQGKNVKLIVIDSIVSPFRSDYAGLKDLVARQQNLNHTIRMFNRIANFFNLVVLMTNQVVAVPDSFIKYVAAGGNVFCLAPDTFVLTNTGLKQLSSINVGDQIYDGNGYSLVTNKIKSNHKEYLIIDNEIVCSPNHRFFLWNGKEVLAKDIKVGDWILGVDKIDTFVEPIKIPLSPEYVYVINNPEVVKARLRERGYSLKRINNPISARHLRKILNQRFPTTLKVIKELNEMTGGAVEYKIIETNRHRKISRVEALTPELAMIFGYWIGDGDTSNKESIVIREQRYGVARFYSDLIERVFSLKPKIINYGTFYELRLNSKYAVGVLNYLKENMFKLFNEREEIIAGFLRGLFDADGTVGALPEVDSKDRVFLSFIKLLLLRLGILSSIIKVTGKNRLFELVILGPYIHKFVSLIGFTSRDKMEKIKYPKGSNKVVKLGKNLIALRVNNIRKVYGNIDMIDITTSSHRFMANGLIVHNSHNINLIVRLKKFAKKNLRSWRIDDSPKIPSAEGMFKITEKGVEDAEP